MTSQRRTSMPTIQGNIADRWQTVLNNRIPLAGGWLRRQSAEALGKLALDGEATAARILANALEHHTDPSIRQCARQFLEASLPAPAMDAVWAVWAASRSEFLAEILQKQGKLASGPPDIRLLSALLLQNETALQNARPEMIEPMVAACQDTNPLLSGRARYALTQLKNSGSIAVLCGLWAKTSSPLLENAMAQAGYQPQQPPGVRILVALKFNRLDLITQGEADGVAPLEAACLHADPEINARARFCLINLQKTDAINEVCSRWEISRSPLLGEAITQARYIASKPFKIRLYSALKANRIDLAANIAAKNLPVLLQASADADPEVSAAAQTALRTLKNTETIDALCLAAVEQENILACQICLETGYLPSLPEQRALFFFLTDQIEKYETLDFDQRMLNAVYEVAGVDLRQKILRKVQKVGRSDFLSILTGAELRNRVSAVTPIEAELLVRILVGNREWERLWGLVFELALPNSIEIVRALVKNNWIPPETGDQVLFNDLAVLASQELVFTGPEFAQAIPLAVPRATLRLGGRVNDLAFSPVGTILAIGTGSGRVALWDYQKASIQKVYKDFDHSIGRLCYTQHGSLLAGERSSNSQPCSIYLCEDGKTIKFGQHNGPVTALESVNDSQILSAGRDSRVVLWDLANLRILMERTLGDWPRNVCISPNGSKAALLSNFINLYSLDTRQPLPDLILSRWYAVGVEKSISRCAAFLSNSELLIGQYNGQVVYYQNLEERPRAKVLAHHEKPVEEISILPGRKVVATAGAEGCVSFFKLPDLVPLGMVELPSGRLSSLRISPDGMLMATGTSDSTMILWDLRTQDLPELFSQPVNKANPSQMPVVNALAGYEQLPASVHNSLLFLQILMQHRFRYDIQVADTAVLRAGEFDVLID